MTMIERVAKALEEAALGYSMNLVRLVDGVSTYSLKYSDGESLEFGSTDEAYEHIASKKRLTQARAAINAMRTLYPAIAAQVSVNWTLSPVQIANLHAQIIDAALSEKEPTT